MTYFKEDTRMTSSQKLTVYINNFDTQNPGPTTNPTLSQLQAYASDIGGSGMTVGVFWALHVRDNGDFAYNDGAALVSGGQLQSGFSELPGLIATMKASGNVTQLLFSVGGWSCESDFVNIQNLIAQYGTGTANPLYQNFLALKHALSIDGIDIDLEANSSPAPYSHDYDYYTDTLVQLAGMLDTIGLTTTFCPYTAEDFWLGCLSKIYAGHHRQLVSTMNLQCYDGGALNTQSQWVGYLQQSASPLGISNPSAFVVPGYDAQQTPPSALQSTFANDQFMSQGIVGGFVWNYGEVLQSGAATSAYASAIVDGIAQL
jgi:Glycosyl hydrolases family 18